MAASVFHLACREVRRLSAPGLIPATTGSTAELHRVFSPGDGRAPDECATPVSFKRDPTEVERVEAALMQTQIERLLQVGELIRHELDKNASHPQADVPHGATAAPWRPADRLRRLMG